MHTETLSEREILSRLQKSVQAMVHGEPGAISLEALCVDAFGLDSDGNPNKSHWTVYREVNPNDSGAKLGYVTLLQLMKARKDARPLTWMLAYLNRAAIPLPEDGQQLLTPENAYERGANVQIALAEVLRRVKASLDDDGKFSRAELTWIFEAVYIAYEALAGIGEGAKQAMDIPQ